MFRWASDRSLRIALGEGISLEAHQRVRSAFAALEAAGIPGVVDLVPSYASLLVTVDPAAADPLETFSRVRRIVGEAEVAAVDGPEPRVVEIPVCYDPALAPDLDEVARLHGMTAADAAALHAAGDYRVHFLGFAPGFPYLGGLDPRLATPRLDRPRTRVPAGSVAIGGAQTGIYPFAMPGGWRIIGRTPLRLFRPERIPPCLVDLGDRVRFVAIDAARFGEIEASEA